MSAKKEAFFDKNRITLWEHLPLDTPFSVGIDTSTVCNFRCRYCAQSAPELFEKINFKPEIMKYDTFEKIVEQLKEFPQKIKKIHLECKGESMCNPKLPEMVSLLKSSDVAESVQIISNGALLTPTLSDKLIAAGLDILCISLQGMSTQKYKEVCGSNITFEEMYRNIKYYYQNKGDKELYVKIVDLALDSKEEEEHFYSVFEEITDRVYVEHIANLFSTIDYEGLIQKDDNTNKYGEKLIMREICGFPFFYLLIFPDGDVRACSNIEPSAVYGNIYNERLIDIWNGKKRLGFLKMQLEKNRKKNKVCRECHRPYENLRPEDAIDGHEEYVYNRIFGER